MASTKNYENQFLFYCVIKDCAYISLVRLWAWL